MFQKLYKKNKLLLIFILLFPFDSIFADYKMLDDLHRFVLPADMDNLQLIADEPQYASKFKTLLSEGWESALFFDPETCNTLYWALQEKKITENEYMDMYHFLTLNLFFMPQKSPVPVFEAQPELADAVSIVSFNSLSAALQQKINNQASGYFEKNESEYGKGEKAFFYEYTLNDFFMEASSFGESTLNAPCGSGQVYKRNLAVKWFRLFDKNIPGIVVDNVAGKIYVPAYTVLSKLVGTMSGGSKGFVHMMPTFGCGCWEDLKVMRKKDQHPLALWSSCIQNTLVEPDGYWIGTLAHLHDVYHVARLYSHTKQYRSFLLTIDDIVNTSFISFLKRVISEDGTPVQREAIKGDDLVFIEGLELQYQEIAYTLVCEQESNFIIKKFPWPAFVETDTFLKIELDNLQEARRRPLIDQEYDVASEYYLHLTHHKRTFNMYHSQEMYQDVSRGRYNWIVFELVQKKYCDLVLKQILCSDDESNHSKLRLGEFPEVRERFEGYKAVAQTGCKEEKLSKESKSAVLQWHIDWWVRHLAGIGIPVVSEDADHMGF